MRNYLGSFMFSGDEIEKYVKVLSGGEKARVALPRALTLVPFTIPSPMDGSETGCWGAKVIAFVGTGAAAGTGAGAGIAMGAGIGFGTTGLGVVLTGGTGAGAGLGATAGAGAGKGSPGAGKGSGLPC